MRQILEDFSHGTHHKERDTVDYSAKLDTRENAEEQQVPLASPLHVKLAGHLAGRTLEAAAELVLAVLLHRRLLADFGKRGAADDEHQWTGVRVEAKALLALGLAYTARLPSTAARWLTLELHQLRLSVAAAGQLALKVSFSDQDSFVLQSSHLWAATDSLTGLQVWAAQCADKVVNSLSVDWPSFDPEALKNICSLYCTQAVEGERYLELTRFGELTGPIPSYFTALSYANTGKPELFVKEILRCSLLVVPKEEDIEQLKGAQLLSDPSKSETLGVFLNRGPWFYQEGNFIDGELDFT